MTLDRRYRLPASSRHAFALAFDLALRRDPIQSLVVPLLLRAPWILTLSFLPPPGDAGPSPAVLPLRILALAGDLMLLLVIGAMLRIRARSVYEARPGVPPAPALECYARGLRRVPWLFVTETMRNAVLVVGTFLLIVPGLFFGFRLAFATEAVVLSDRRPPGAFAHSFRLTEGRFERWFEMVVLSVACGLAVFFVGGVLHVAGRGGPLSDAAGTVTWLLITAATPIIQYAWTFFYLRLLEGEAVGEEVGPAYAGAVEPETAAVPAPFALVGSGAPAEGPNGGGSGRDA